MSKFVFFALLCMASLGSASAHVYKSIGADGKVTYSDHPGDKPAASVSIIKAAIVQPVVAAKTVTLAPTAAAPRISFLTTAAESLELTGKPVVQVTANATQVCDKKIDVLVGRNGDIVKVLGPSPLSSFKTK